PGQETGLFLLRLQYIWRELTGVLTLTRAGVAALWLAATALWIARASSGRPFARARSAALIGCSIGLCLATVAFVYVTNNAAANGLALWPLVVVTAWLAFRSIADDAWLADSWRTVVVRSAAALLLVAGVADAWRFDRAIDASRVLTTEFDPT